MLRRCALLLLLLACTNAFIVRPRLVSRGGQVGNKQKYNHMLMTPRSSRALLRRFLLKREQQQQQLRQQQQTARGAASPRPLSSIPPLAVHHSNEPPPTTPPVMEESKSLDIPATLTTALENSFPSPGQVRTCVCVLIDTYACTYVCVCMPAVLFHGRRYIICLDHLFLFHGGIKPNTPIHTKKKKTPYKSQNSSISSMAKAILNGEEIDEASKAKWLNLMLLVGAGVYATSLLVTVDMEHWRGWTLQEIFLRIPCKLSHRLKCRHYFIYLGHPCALECLMESFRQIITLLYISCVSSFSPHSLPAHKPTHS